MCMGPVRHGRLQRKARHTIDLINRILNVILYKCQVNIAAVLNFMNTICSGNQGGEHCNVEAESGTLNCQVRP